MTVPLIGCIADDHTGATDLSSMLVRAGLRVVQYFGSPGREQELRDPSSAHLRGADAVVIALKSRSIPANEAVRESLAALASLKSLGATRIFFKYCSTFDSTPAGNIGPVSEALADRLGVKDIWHCPAFPENGRTVYCGYLFVGGVPLHESGMQHHPLNPMTDSNLIRILQAQSTHRVGLFSLNELHAGTNTERTMSEGQHRIIDAISDQDLQRIATLAADHRLLNGGSAIARYWAAAMGHGQQRSVGTDPREPDLLPVEPACKAYPQTLILAGSCSSATREQITAFARIGEVIPLRVLEAAEDRDAFDRVVEGILDRCRLEADRRVALITSAWEPHPVRSAVRELGEQRAAELTESLFAAIAQRAVQAGVRTFVVAGGETSGAVINALQIQAVRIGQEISPGVPWIHTTSGPGLSLALKSGNFGGRDFFQDAISSLRLTEGVSGRSNERT